MLDAINEQLAPEEQVADRTFEVWKTRASKGETPTPDSVEAEFLRLYKKAIREQKKTLMVAFSTDMQWQRWAWILERKFTEWNLKDLS